MFSGGVSGECLGAEFVEGFDGGGGSIGGDDEAVGGSEAVVEFADEGFCRFFSFGCCGVAVGFSVDEGDEFEFLWGQGDVVGLVFFRREVFEVGFEPVFRDAEGFVFDLGCEVGGCG